MKLKSSDKNYLFQVKRENTEKVALKLGNVTIKTKNFRLYGPFYGWVQLSLQGSQSFNKEEVYFLLLRPHEALVLIFLT